MSAAPAALAYDDTPPFSAPLRFFLTAPLFGLAAGGVLLLDGDALSSRWTPGALASVHLIAAGFMLQVMLGALLQILPVAAGARVPRALRVAAATHLLISPGGAGLALGLWRGEPVALLAGGVLLVTGLAIFLAAALVALRAAPIQPGSSQTPRDLRLALAALTLVAVLGLLLTVVLGRGLALPLALPDLVNLHALWAWVGWGAILLAATSWVVVPMFQITPPYPTRLTRHWAPLTLGTLLLWSAGVLAGSTVLGAAASAALMLLAAAFAVQTLRLQQQSRRRVADPVARGFGLAMLSALASVAALIAAQHSDAAHWPVLAGILVLHGSFVGAISAMLCKIVPFLAWLHLTQARIRATHIKKLLPERRIRVQLGMHAVALVLLVGAVFMPVLTAVAGAALVIEFAALALNLVLTVGAWRRAAQA